MDPTLDAVPFPFHTAKGQELLRTLIAMYRSEREIQALLDRVELPWVDFLPVGATVTQLWREALQAANARGATRNLIQQVLSELPNNPRADSLRSLLAGARVVASTEPSGPNGEPPFNSDVTVKESLLFHDDLTIPTRNIGGLIETLQTLQKLAPAVCLLRVRSPYGDTAGTGFRIGGDLVLTNEHVLVPGGMPAAGVTAVDVESGMELAGDLASIATDRGNDWGVIEVAGMNAALPVVDLAAAVVPTYGDLSYIIQHPGGQDRRLGFVRNVITDVTAQMVHYLTDTQPGSSGAPVFDVRGKIVALHHAGGSPVEVAGKPPVSKNEGIRIDVVYAQLKARGVI